MKQKTGEVGTKGGGVKLCCIPNKSEMSNKDMVNN